MNLLRLARLPDNPNANFDVALSSLPKRIASSLVIPIVFDALVATSDISLNLSIPPFNAAVKPANAATEPISAAFVWLTLSTNLPMPLRFIL